MNDGELSIVPQIVHLGTSASPMELLHHSWSFSISHGNSLSPTGLLHHLWNISIILVIRIMSLCAWYTYTHTHTYKNLSEKKKKEFLWVKYFTLKLQRVRGTQDFIKLSHWALQNQIYLAQAFSGIHDQGVTWKDGCGMEAASVSTLNFWANSKANCDGENTVSLLMPLSAPVTELPKLDDNVCGKAVLTWGPHRCEKWRGLRRHSKTLSPVTRCGMAEGNKI